MAAEFGFCVDSAADHDNTLCRHYLTEADDALNDDWHTHGAIFCNPPYSNIMPWVKRPPSNVQFRSNLS
ncbi:DNA N-6-adenine-methyltransferase [Candidatus Sodalis endolongispinus]|uniref:DNA N-6-adenine-methyltransferase n=1 Tax=Candidatus Sodalis endolongispinus TaxID=2812662 RepID=UPI0035E4678B